MLVLRSGLKDAHSHLDTNALLLYAYGETLLDDPQVETPYPEGYFAHGGKARHDWSATRGHSTVLMDGMAQREELDRGGRITHFLPSTQCDYIRSDGTDAYPDKAQRVVRHVLFMRPEYFIVIDNLRAEWPAQWEWLGQSSGALTVDDRGATIRGARTSLRLEVVEPTGFSGRVGAHDGERKYLSLAGPLPCATTRFATVLYPWARTVAGADRCPARFAAAGEDGGRVTLEVARAAGRQDTISWADSPTGTGKLAVTAVSRGPDRRLLGYSVYGCSEMESDGRRVLVGDGPVWAAVALDGDAVHCMVLVPDEPLTLRIWCPTPPSSATLDGEPCVACRYDRATGLLVTSLEPGLHDLRISP